MPNVTLFPNKNYIPKTARSDQLAELIRQTYPNPLIHDLYWVFELLASVRSDVEGVDTWFDGDNDNVCFFEFRLTFDRRITVRCEGVEETSIKPDRLSYLKRRYKAVNNSCLESIRLQITNLATPCFWTQDTITFPHHHTTFIITEH